MSFEPYEMFYVDEMELSLKCRTLSYNKYMCVNDICSVYCKPMRRDELNKIIFDYVYGKHLPKKITPINHTFLSELFFLPFTNVKAFLFHCLKLKVFYPEMQYLVQCWKNSNSSIYELKPSNAAFKRKPFVKRMTQDKYIPVKKPSFK